MHYPLMGILTETELVISGAAYGFNVKSFNLNFYGNPGNRYTC